MKVIEILNQTCSLLGLTAEQEILQNAEINAEDVLVDGGTGTISALENAEIKRLFTLLQFSLRELCTNYLEISTVKEVESENKLISLNSLNNFIRLIDVYYNGQSTSYKVINRKINLNFDGTFMVKYQTYPSIKTLNDNIEEYGIYNIDLIVIGLCAYYALATGRFDEFNSFHAQYIEKAESVKTLKSLQIPTRRWE